MLFLKLRYFHLFVGFKCEWACVKDENLYVGSLGKEWTSTTGVVKNLNPQWIKVINKDGAVKHIDWHENYNALRKKTRTMLPGMMLYNSTKTCSVKLESAFFF